MGATDKIGSRQAVPCQVLQPELHIAGLMPLLGGFSGGPFAHV